MAFTRGYAGILSLLLLGGCAADPTNDPHGGGFFGGVHGLAAGDYETRQQGLQEQRDDSLNQLRALREEGAYLESERQMKADEVAEQRRQLASLKARNRALAKRVDRGFDQVQQSLLEYRSGDTYVTYDKLTKTDVRKLAQSVDGLSEPLSQVSTVVLR